MNNDSIEAILDDATMSPKAYCHKWGCGQGIYDELADYVPDMCIHLIGRTEAVMRHNASDEVYEGVLRELEGQNDNLEELLAELFECLDAHRIAHLAPTDYTCSIWFRKLKRHGVLEGDAK